MSRTFAVHTGWALLFAVAAPSSQALDVSVPCTSVVTIANGPAGSRFLMDFGSFSSLREEVITSARLVVPLSGAIPASDIRIDISGVARDWGPSATWMAPWTTPGGDLDLDLRAEAVIPGGRIAATLDVDVLDLVQPMADGSVAENGLVLRPDNALRMGFTRAELAAIGSLQGATIEVTYRSLRAHGVRGGAARFVARRRQAIEEGRIVPPK